MEFKPIAKPKKVVVQSYIKPEMAKALEVIGHGSRSGGLKIVLDNLEKEIMESAKRIKKAS